VRKREGKGKGKGKTTSDSRETQGEGTTGDEDGWTTFSPRNRKPKDAISTFYFSHFRENYGENDMRAIFQRWEKVKELFIVLRRNNDGFKYWFVRYNGVLDEIFLERKLDHIFI